MAESRKQPKARKYTDELRDQALAALAANCGDLKETARQLQNIFVNTLRRWRDNNPNASQSTPGDRKRQDMAAEFESIAWLLVRAMPEKITDAPLNQLISALKFTRETIHSIRNEQLTRDTFPLDLSKMTNEQLEQLERLTTLLLGYSQGPSIPEHSGPGFEDYEDGDADASSGLEPALLAPSLSPNGGEC